MPHKMNTLRGWAVVDGNWSQFKYVARTKVDAEEQWARAHDDVFSVEHGWTKLRAGLKTKTLRVVKIRVEEV